MPIASGAGKTNYYTTINLSKNRDGPRSPAAIEVYSPQPNKGNEVEVYRVPAVRNSEAKLLKLRPVRSTAYVSDPETDEEEIVVRDPKLREVVKNLVKRSNYEMETGRKSDKDIVTQVEYKDYSLFLSKNGLNPFENRGNHKHQLPAVQTISYESDIFNNQQFVRNPGVPRPLTIVRPQEDPERVVFSTPYAPAPAPNAVSSDNSKYDFQDEFGHLYFINEIQNLDSNVIINPVTRTVDFTENVVRAIQANLKVNPLETGDERPYKLVFNKDRITSQQTPQVVRVTVRKPVRNDKLLVQGARADVIEDVVPIKRIINPVVQPEIYYSTDVPNRAPNNAQRQPNNNLLIQSNTTKTNGYNGIYATQQDPNVLPVVYGTNNNIPPTQRQAPMPPTAVQPMVYEEPQRGAGQVVHSPVPPQPVVERRTSPVMYTVPRNTVQNAPQYTKQRPPVSNVNVHKENFIDFMND